MPSTWEPCYGVAPRWRRPKFGGGFASVTVFGHFFYWRYGRA